MADSLSKEMLAAYDRSGARAKRIRKAYEGEPTFKDHDRFELKVRNRFLEGVHSAFCEEIIASLERELGTQQQIADALGLKDRTSISQMIRSGTMDGIRITAAIYQFSHILTLPPRERAALYGFARATSYIKAEVYQETSIDGSMTAQEFSDLIGLLASEEWDDALKNVNPDVARAVAVRIVNERGLDKGGGRTRSAYRPEQCVMILRDVQESWGDYGIVALSVIPDCIPEDESVRKARL